MLPSCGQAAICIVIFNPAALSPVPGRQLYLWALGVPGLRLGLWRRNLSADRLGNHRRRRSPGSVLGNNSARPQGGFPMGPLAEGQWSSSAQGLAQLVWHLGSAAQSEACGPGRVVALGPALPSARLDGTKPKTRMGPPAAFVLLAAGSCTGGRLHTVRGLQPVVPRVRIQQSANSPIFRANRISLSRLTSTEELDRNKDGEVSVREAEVAIFGPPSNLDIALSVRTYIILMLVPVIFMAAFHSLPEIVDAVSSTALVRRTSSASRALSSTLITSVLLPSNSLLFGTLVSASTSRLWERQRHIREELNSELQLVEDITAGVNALFDQSPAERTKALCELRGYLLSVICECSPRCTVLERQVLVEEQRQRARQLHALIYSCVNDELIESSSLPNSVATNVASALDVMITELGCARHMGLVGAAGVSSARSASRAGLSVPAGGQRRRRTFLHCTGSSSPCSPPPCSASSSSSAPARSMVRSRGGALVA